ncbi:formate dehydrogenase accessory sulfurtransferase FdhD [Amycolatopsis sp. H20-H5]|uniref:formate dehydrogenase accessory sulfurtransferase FdhD n=1 Tax=Amycolatopsis sp. H20-H5 TaxID=3046309 RepID=UPI002DB8DFFF|nr:formate dehydrogenase accessory sulfurtransferase FdhD [Amycolatopsis sp. H20-H5]MEC3979102.1 formate dehydrogenase accessory sulfurtransferase FdhD [Amycolatopsis sp. H20-H5]
MGRVTVRRPVRMIRATGDVRRPDALAAEEPLELRVDGKALAVTMRTPGNDVELAHGFLLTEGVLGSREDVASARFCDGVDDQGRNTYNVLDVALADGVPPPETGVERNFYTTSSCGVCGKAALDAVKLRSRFSPGDSPFTVRTEVLAGLPGALRTQQKVFATTGGLHAAALFDSDGSLAVVREDVGRHNAVDKVLGWALLNGRIPAGDNGLLVSGRASFELVQKAAMAGVGLLAAVSAPSSLAAELADENGMTLIGFLRGDSMNLYSGEQRVLS